MARLHQPSFSRWSRTRRWATGTGLLAAGAIGGGILVSGLTAGAATSPTTTAPAAHAPAGWGGLGDRGFGGRGFGGPGTTGSFSTGTVTAIGASSVTIKTSTATTTYAVTSSSHIDKNGVSSLKSLKVGDAVTFDTVSGAAKPTIDKLHAGSGPFDHPTGPFGGGFGGRFGGPGAMGSFSTGTVTAIGASSVTIKTSTATTTYAVTSSSDIDKNGEATLKSLKAGDAVTFDTVSGAAKPTIDKLHAGSEALDRPTGGPRGGFGGPAGGYGGGFGTGGFGGRAPSGAPPA